MDLNYLYHWRQVELMRADAADCACSRSSHLRLASEYGERIKRWRDDSTTGSKFA